MRPHNQPLGKKGLTNFPCEPLVPLQAISDKTELLGRKTLAVATVVFLLALLDLAAQVQLVVLVRGD
jgi:hypothetical protein